ncbi:MAG TPA: histidine ammonia-lyase [Chloroflexota bacterium]
MTPLTINCGLLTVSEVASAARDARRVELGPLAIQAMQGSRLAVDRLVAERRVVYGITTGFGKFADRVIPYEALELLQHNLIVSHCVGVGAPLAEEVVRAMIILRAASLARGYSGIRPETVQTLLDIMNAGIIPHVPSKGSVGASGDLAPLAHLALVLIGQGHAYFNGELVPAENVLKTEGITPVRLAAKEGLALINGTQLMTALGVMVVDGARNVLDVADVAGCLSLEAFRGTNRAFDPRVHEVRPHTGQIESAARMRILTADSEIMNSHREDSHRVQDPYSLRCMPQIHGASRDAIAYVSGVIETEINSVTDNPLIFGLDDVISCGNFHGQPLALALDFAAIALAELASVSERRIEAMLDPHLSELPPFLTMHGGVDSGLMVSQYTAAALVSENKVLSHPASVDSIPTSANQEDHVSMGVTAGLKAIEILHNVETVLAIELLCGAAGLEFRRPLRTSAPLEAVHALIRSEVSPLESDRVLYPDIQNVSAMVRDGRVRSSAREL